MRRFSDRVRATGVGRAAGPVGRTTKSASDDAMKAEAIVVAYFVSSGAAGPAAGLSFGRLGSSAAAGAAERTRAAAPRARGAGARNAAARPRHEARKRKRRLMMTQQIEALRFTVQHRDGGGDDAAAGHLERPGSRL